MNRREFLKKSGITAVAATATALPSSRAGAEDAYYWKMVTTWRANTPVFHPTVIRFAQRVDEVSGGRLKIKVYAAGELIPAMDVFNTVASGKVQAGAGAPQFWVDKIPAAQWFSAVPFGLNAQAMNTWLYSGGGLSLWEEVYEPYKLLPRPLGNSGVQMAGWFKKPIERTEEVRDLRMRISGLGGKVVGRMGARVLPVANTEIFASLKEGTLDAVTWGGPMQDLRLGLYQAAKYYYYPGWQEPANCLEVVFNQKAYNALPEDLQAILDAVAMETNLWSLSRFEIENASALQTLLTEHKVTLLKLPESILETFRLNATRVMEEAAGADLMAAKVYEAYMHFKHVAGPWDAVSRNAYSEISSGNLM